MMIEIKNLKKSFGGRFKSGGTIFASDVSTTVIYRRDLTVQ